MLYIRCIPLQTMHSLSDIPFLNYLAAIGDMLAFLADTLQCSFPNIYEAVPYLRICIQQDSGTDAVILSLDDYLQMSANEPIRYRGVYQESKAVPGGVRSEGDG